MAKRQQKQSDEQHLKSEEALHFSEDRMQLLETVRQMIDAELERREQEKRQDTPPSNSPRPCQSLWQKLMERGKRQATSSKR